MTELCHDFRAVGKWFVLALARLAFAEIEMGQLDKAEANLKESLKLVPGHPGAKA